jgi:hypothetical protein
VKKKKRGRSVSFDETVTVLDRRGRTARFPLAPGDGTAASASFCSLSLSLSLASASVDEV